MAKITSNNFISGAIVTNKFDTSIASDINNANTANSLAATVASQASATFNSANTIATSLTTLTPSINVVTITNSSWNALDDTAANTGGGYCVITGSNFNSNTSVVFGTTSATAVTYVNSTTLRVQIPALAATSYPVYVINNSNGATAIKPNAITVSSSPVWGTAATLANVTSNVVFSTSLSANSDSSVTYSNTTILPTGTTLLSNGYYYGNVSVGIDTTYSFDVKATDTELQDQTRTFSLTVTVTPPVVAKSFSISPTVSGKSTWDLNTDGALNITSGNYTIIPNSTFTCNVRMWGGGGGGSAAGGAGAGAGSSIGIMTLNSGTPYNMIVGTGGNGTGINRAGASGGGGTGIQFTGNSVAIIVAGGGGGGAGAVGGAGGGSSGDQAPYPGGSFGGFGGTQSAAGSGGSGPRRNGAPGSGRNGGGGNTNTPGQPFVSGGPGFGNGGPGADNPGDCGSGGGGGG